MTILWSFIIGLIVGFVIVSRARKIPLSLEMTDNQVPVRSPSQEGMRQPRETDTNQE